MNDRLIEIKSDHYCCLRCGEELDGATNITGELLPDASAFEALEAMDGAANVCVYCTNVAIFVIDRGVVKLRWPRADERLELADDELVQRTVQVFRGLWLVRLLGRIP